VKEELMTPTPIDRRSFLAAAGVAAVGQAAKSPATNGKAGPVSGAPLRLGAPVSEPSGDPESLARAHAAKGYRAAYCPSVDLADRERIRATAEAFARHDVVIAEVGRWVNLLDTDLAARRKNLATVTEGLALADAVGARCCVDIAGSFSPTSSRRPWRTPARSSTRSSRPAPASATR
jgi:sugar phosphate isomerase/epimerase